MAGLVVGILGILVSVAGTAASVIMSNQSQAQMAEEADKNDLRSKSALARELNLANAQVRRTALMAGKSMVELINAKRRNMIVSRREYANNGAPINTSTSSAAKISSRVGGPSVSSGRSGPTAVG